MQDLILVISRCISKRKSVNLNKTYFRFHFRGYYAGEKIKVIHLFPTESKDNPLYLTKGDDYLLWVKRKRVIEEVLEVELIKFKKII